MRRERISVNLCNATAMMLQAECEYENARCSGDYDRAVHIATMAFEEFAKAMLTFSNDYPYTEKFFDSVMGVKMDIEHLECIRAVKI